MNSSTRVHLDTDFGGDPDDTCALAMLLGWPGVDLVGITTNLDADGGRAGCVGRYLDLAGRAEIPIAAGAGETLTWQDRFESTWSDARYWPTPVEPRPSAPGEALRLLDASIERGATLVATGAMTNLAMLEITSPGRLDGVPIVVMGGWVRPPAVGLPPWGPEMDWNVQCDPRAAEIVFGSGADLSLVTMPAAMAAHLRESDLPRLTAAGPIGALLARQSRANADDYRLPGLGQAHAGLPDDLVNIHWDGVACAVALGWPGVVVEELELALVVDQSGVWFREQPNGRRTRVTVAVDGDAFREVWMASVEAVGAAGAARSAAG